MMAEWKVIVAASANSLESSVIGKSPENEALWEKWIADDDCRAEIPMTQDYRETWPMGMAVDFTSQSPIPMGDNVFHPPSPILCLLATDGRLTLFHMMNSHQGVPSLQKTVEPLSEQGARKGKAPQPQQQQQQQPQTPLATMSTPTAPPQQETAAPLGNNTAVRTLFHTPAATTSSSSQNKPQDAVAPETPKSQQSTLSATSSMFGSSAAATGKPSMFGNFGAGSQNPATSGSGFAFGGSQNQATSGSSAGFSFSALNSVAQTPALGALSKPVAQSTPAPPPPTALQGTAAAKPPEPAATTTTADVNKPKTSGFNFGTAAPSSQTESSSSGFSFNLQQQSSSQPQQQQPTKTAATMSFGSNLVPQNQQPPAAAQGFGSKPLTQNLGNQKPTQFAPAQTIKQPTTPVARQVQSVKRTSGLTQASPQSVLPQSSQSQATAPASKPPGSTGQTTPTAARPVAHARRKSHESEDPFMKTIMEEMEHFQKELNDLRSRSSGTFEVIGDRAEMTEMVQNSKEMTDFCKDIKQQTQDINGEIHALKSECLESFATIEECRAREERNRDPSYRHLLGSRSLDPMSERKMKEIRTQFHYVDNGVRDVDLKLDMEWEEYQRKKKRGGTLKTPASDAIYRTVTNNKRIIDNHMHKLDRLCGELRDLKLYNSTGWEARKKATTGLGSPLVNDSNSSLNQSRGRSPLVNGTGDSTKRYEPRTLGSVKKASNSLFFNRSLSSMTETTFNASVSPQAAAGSSISPEKQAKLRDVLGNRRVTPVKSTAPANLSVSRFVSSERLQEMTQNTFSQGQSGLEASYLDTHGRNVTQTAVNSPATAKSPAKPPSTFSFSSGAGGATAKTTAFAAVKQNSPKLSPVNDNKGFAFGGDKSKGNDSSKTTPKAGSGLAIGGGILGAKATQGFSFGTSPATTATAQNFSSPAAATKIPPTAAATNSPKTITANLASSGASTTAKPVAKTLGSTQSTPVFEFKQSTESKSASNKPFVFNTASAPSTDQTSTESKGGSTTAKPPPSAGFSFNATPTAKSDAPSFSFGPTNADSKTSAPTKGFGFGGSGTTPGASGGLFGGGSTAPKLGEDKGSKDKIGQFSAFSGAGMKLGTAGDSSVTGGNQNIQDRSSVGSSTASSQQSVAQSSSITSDVMKGLLSKPEGNGEGGMAGLFGASSDSGMASLNSGDFQLGGALASILVEDTATSSAQNTGTSRPTVPATANSSAGFAFNAANMTGAPIQKPATVIKSDQSSESASVGFSFGQRQSSTTTSVLSFGSTAASDSSSKSKDTELTAVKQRDSDVPSPHITGELEISEVSSAGASQKNEVKSSGATGFSFGSTSAPTTGFSFGAAAKTEAATPATTQAVAAVNTTTAAVAAATTAAVVTAKTEPVAAVAPTQDGVKNVTASSKDPSVQAVTSTTTPSVAPATAPTPTAPATTSGATGFNFGGTGMTTGNEQPSAAVSTSAAAATTAASMFGGPATQQTNSTTTQPPLPTTVATTSIQPQAAVSGTTTSSSSGTMFGSQTTSTSSSSGLFGNQTTTAPSSGVFGASQMTGATEGGFGAQTTSTSTAGGIFGSQTSTAAPFGSQPTASSIFGNQPSNTTTTAGGLFGNQSATTTSSGGLFGQPSTTTAGSIFGNQPPTPGTGGMFGSQPSTTTSGGPFGSQAAATTTAAGGLFGTQTAAPTSSGFGSGGFGFGQPAVSSTSSATGGFGAAPSFGQSGGFGNSGGSAGLFGSSSSGGGGLFGLGGKPSAENANKNVFGSGFGSSTPSTQSQTLFGNQASSAFNTVSGGTAGTGGSFSSGGGSFSGGGVSSSGFGGFGAGAQQTPQKSGGFGASPAFGGGPAFGSPPSFGSQATFGASTFGAGAGGGGGAIFGSAANQNAGGFASFAASDAPSFGNLAQSGSGGGGGSGFGGFGQQQPTQQQPMFGSGGGGTFGGFGGGNTGGGFGQQNQQPGFGQNPAPTSPSFSSYRG